MSDQVITIRKVKGGFIVGGAFDESEIFTDVEKLLIQIRYDLTGKFNAPR